SLLTRLSTPSRPRPAHHPFPTRRSSDLPQASEPAQHKAAETRTNDVKAGEAGTKEADIKADSVAEAPLERPPAGAPAGQKPPARSEEHTSELQSHLNLVCRLLLEKKNNN